MTTLVFTAGIILGTWFGFVVAAVLLIERR